MLIALDLHEFNNARWLVLGFLVTESASGPLVWLYLYAQFSSAYFECTKSVSVRTCSSNLWSQKCYFVCSHGIVHWSFSVVSEISRTIEKFVQPTHISSLSHRLWQVALSRVVVGTGTAGVELLIVVIINGRSSTP